MSIRRALRAEVALWNSAREGRVPSLVALSRVAPIVLLLAALLRVLAGSLAPPAAFPLMTPAAAQAMAAGVLLPTAVVHVASAIAKLDESAWRWLGPTQKHASSTSEPERRGAFVLHPMNTYSSHAQTAAGGYILARACDDDARAPIASAAYGATMILMGLASVVWWGSRRDAAQRLDSWLMETVTGASAAAYWAVGAPEHEIACVGTWALVTVLRAATLPRRGNLLWPTLAATCGYCYSALSLGGCGLLWRYVAGVGGMALGLLMKMLDTAQGRAWGTAAFHYAMGGGAVMLWLWVQSLPL